MEDKELYRGPMPEAHVGGTINRVDVMCVRCGKPVRVEYESDTLMHTSGYCCGLRYATDWAVQLVVSEDEDARRIHANKS